jgi:hypothetical protein
MIFSAMSEAISDVKVSRDGTSFVGLFGFRLKER